MLDAATLCMACLALTFAIAEISLLFGFGLAALACFAVWRFVPPNVGGFAAAFHFRERPG
ncbi:hypothetical protein [Nisaea nitritireducens]|uniref:hypothetical protein n=1 Tax=Nisaea nitritireducens TaxID=568392 RepID=UPI001868402E|nr:hypothetical protein [Nisaea nitritireducens]